MQDKSTKDRLDELSELHNGGYITEGEFKTARLNILKEGGIDVVTQLQQAHRQYLQEEAEERNGTGCGCFLVTLLLAGFFLLGAVFFAAPYWPERFGGAAARSAREWFTAKAVGIIDGMFKEPDARQVPDPAASDDRPANRPVIRPSVSSDIEVGPVIVIPMLVSADQASPDRAIVLPQPAGAAEPDMPSVDAHPSEPQAPAQAPVPEIEVIAAAESADLPAALPGDAVRGRVRAQGARLRSAPDTSTNENVIGWARLGDTFAVAETGVGNDGSPWYSVVFDNSDKRGWISGSLVRLEERDRQDR